MTTFDIDNVLRRRRESARTDAIYVLENARSKDPAVKKQVLESWERARKTLTGRRALGALGGVDPTDKRLKVAVATTMSLFPKSAKGRGTVLEGLQKSTGYSTSVLASAADIPMSTTGKLISKSRQGPLSVRVSNENAQVGQEKKSIGEHERNLLLRWVNQEAQPKSGADRDNTLYMEQTWLVFYARLRALLPCLAYEESVLNPKYHTDSRPPDKDLTRHDKNVWAAKEIWREPGFDEAAFINQRLHDAMESLYVDDWERPRERRGAFDPSTWIFVPRDPKTVRKVIDEAGLHVHVTADQHACPLCEKGPAWVTERDVLVERSSRGDSDMEQHDRDQLRQLQKNVDRYERHMRQVKKQRDYIKDIENNLKDGEGLLYRDFVSSYSCTGAKITDLVFVLLTRERGVLRQQNIHNFTGEVPPRSDCYFYVDAMQHLIKETGLVDDLTKLYVAGDHGPHFCAHKAWYFDSEVYEKSRTWRSTKDVKTPLEVHCHYLPSYHAFNLCNGVGASVKLAALRSALRGGTAGWPSTGRHYAAMVNQKKVAMGKKSKGCHVACFFPSINRGEWLFPNLDEKTNKNAAAREGLRQMCEVQYKYEKDGTDERTVGVLLAREVSGAGKFRVVDLTPTCNEASKGRYCQNCSTSLQRPVYHDGVARCNEVCPPRRQCPTAQRRAPRRGRAAVGRQLAFH